MFGTVLENYFSPTFLFLKDAHRILKQGKLSGPDVMYRVPSTPSPPNPLPFQLVRSKSHEWREKNNGSTQTIMSIKEHTKAYPEHKDSVNGNYLYIDNSI